MKDMKFYVCMKVHLSFNDHVYIGNYTVHAKFYALNDICMKVHLSFNITV